VAGGSCGVVLDAEGGVDAAATQILRSASEARDTAAE
jgi:hypothetical protein